MITLAKHYQKLTFMVMATGLTFSLVGCGKWAKAPEQTVDAEPVPSYPETSEHVLGLQGTDRAVGFGGTMLIFNDDTTPELIADVLQASLDSRVAWAEARRFEVESEYKLMYTDRGIVPSAIDALKKDLDAFTQVALAKTPIPLETKTENAIAWFPQELDKLYGPEDSVDRVAAVAFWPYYCDAKLFELATNSYFAAATFSQRPTPMAFCEGHYQSQGYFQDPLCADNEAGQNYFACLWKDGVVKTWWFKNGYFAESEAETGLKEKFDGLLSEPNLETFRRILALDESAMSFPAGGLGTVYKRKVFGNNPAERKRTYFSDLILKQNADTSVCPKILDAQVATLCQIFARNETQIQAGDVFDPANPNFPLTPQSTVDLMEQKTTTNRGFFEFPERPGSSFTTHDILAFFGIRDGHNNSESDRSFFQIVEGGEWKLSTPDLNDQLAAKADDIKATLASTVYGMLNEQDQQIYNEKLAKIQKLEKDLASAKAENDRLQENITKSSDDGFTAGNTGNVAHAFVEIRLKVSRRAGVARAYFWVKDFDETVVLACLDIETTKMIDPSDCKADKLDGVDAKRWLPAKSFYIDPTNGKLELELTMIDPVAMGLGPKARVEEGTPDSFMDLAEAELIYRELYFELFPNKLLGHLEIMSGKAFIRDDGKDLYEAGVSVWDQNL